MPRKVIINNTTFVVNSYSKEGAVETLADLLKRVIIKNAEQEFKKNPQNTKENQADITCYPSHIERT